MITMFVGETNQAILEIAEKDKEIAMLNFINKVRDNARDSTELYSEILKKSVKVIEAGMGFMLLKKSKSFVIKAKEGDVDKKILDDLAENAIKNNQPTIYNRILNENIIRANISSILSIPLVFDNEPVGAFIILNKKFSRSFNRYDMKLSATIARQIYFASKKLDYLNNLEIAAKTAAFETKIAKAKSKKAVMSQLAGLFECEFGFVADVKGEAASVTVSTIKLEKELMNLVSGISEEAVKASELVNHDNESDSLRSIVCIPLMKEGKVKSVIGLANTKNKKFSSTDKELLSGFVEKSKVLN